MARTPIKRFRSHQELLLSRMSKSKMRFPKAEMAVMDIQVGEALSEVVVLFTFMEVQQ